MDIDGQTVDINTFRSDWALALMSQGVVVRLSISRWRATSKLTPNELGLVFSDSESKNFMDRYINLGHEKLLPPQVMRDMSLVETQARRTLSNYSFDTVWGKFVPYSAFAEWKEQNEEDRANFFNVARGIGDQYDTIIQEVKDEYKKMGTDAWNRLYPNSTGEPSPSFVENFINRIIAKIPPREEIVASFKYETTFFVIPMPSMVEEDLSRARVIEQAREASETDHDLELETKRFVAEEYKRRKKELVDGFLESTVAYLRHHIAELSKTVLRVLHKNEKDITATHVKKIQKMIKQVKTLNFYNDTEINALLQDLNVEVSKFKGERDKKTISVTLQKLVDLAENEFLPNHSDPMVDFIEIR